MQFYRGASWLYVLVGSLALPVLVLDMCVDWPGLTAAWATLFALSVPLMAIQIAGLGRVLRERAAFEGVSSLLTWYWAIHVGVALLLAVVAGLYLAGQLHQAFWAVLIGALPVLGAGVAVGVVALVLGIRLARYPEPLFGLRRALQVGFVITGSLGLGSLVLFVSIPLYAVAAMALMFLIAFIIEGHARRTAPGFGTTQVWISYVLAALFVLTPPLAGLQMLIRHFDDAPVFDEETAEDAGDPHSPATALAGGHDAR
jgi:hypothetical protein